ncbi:four helix bundle protein [Roseivirga ehrenbergii]|uniref:Four helix bundle protein n=1 Tax=Roseivirga ehrenbergii (strain DSM 102268 / JCM 13514 / KCTC 12282 / NCIMB 14502 / KMM 6017) TaxID=279360 RepID=A0A150XLP2_ROSEK|nr:four helix bundle protein [Roseivirga ehrenbergii]KYG79593.1 hypothetical protein MB14_17175 [Roseivirga ehrenbergii]TCL01069.1 four helix bundle protein [Roseivirga ehrenbergii]
MNRQDIIKRHRKFVLDIVHVCDALPKSYSNGVFARQLIRASSSVGANYRAAGRGKSTADFINKLKIVEEEADECSYFLDLILALNRSNTSEVQRLIKESEEILAMTVAAIKTARSNAASNTRTSNMVNRNSEQ